MEATSPEGRPCVLKQFDSITRLRLRREVTILATSRSPFVLPIEGVFQEAPDVWYVQTPRCKCTFG